MKQLEYAFSLFDRDGSGMLRVPHIVAYNRVLQGKKDESSPGAMITPHGRSFTRAPYWYVARGRANAAGPEPPCEIA